MSLYLIPMIIRKSILAFLVSVLLISCKKENTENQVKEPYIQYFMADLAGKPLDIKGSLSSNRDLFRGCLTRIGYGNGTSKEMYTVSVQVPKTILGTTIDSKLQFQLFDVQEKEYLLTSNRAFQEDFSTHIYLVTNLGMPNSKIYTAFDNKLPFKISILKYEKPNDGSIPFVGGKLTGVLYNTTDLQDSIIIKNGAFDVRF